MAPCATAGSISAGSTGVAGTSDRPNRFNPALAKNVHSATPSSNFFRRVCTFPRNSTTFKSGRRFSNWARRRRLDVPTTAPSASSVIEPIVGEMNASLTSSRGKYVSNNNPSGWIVGMSFIEWTAMSILPANRSSSISRVNRPLPPMSFKGRSWIMSPVTLMTTTTNASSGNSKAVIRRPLVS